MVVPKVQPPKITIILEMLLHGVKISIAKNVW